MKKQIVVHRHMRNKKNLITFPQKLWLILGMPDSLTFFWEEGDKFVKIYPGEHKDVKL